MIVLDEEIYAPSISKPIKDWYAGRVISINALLPKTVIKDDSFPSLLQKADHPSFVTINVSDFWHITPANANYSIICVELTAKQLANLPDLLRRFLRQPQFKTKSARMGKVVRLRFNKIEFYESDKQIHTLQWGE